MLSYRLFVEVTAQRDSIEKLALEQVHSWLRSKALDGDALRESRVVPLAEHADGFLLTGEERDGSRRVRVRLVERQTIGTWVSEVTLEVPGSPRAQPWLMIEIDGPRMAKPPRLVSGMLEVLSARQGSVDYAPAPHLVGIEELGDLVDTILDPDRRSLLFVAGSSEDLPLPSWRDHVGRLTRETVGLAASYVLDPAATRALTQRLGINHDVPPWTVRTFRPGIDLEDPLDARRHRVLSRDRIVRDRVPVIASMLGRRASEVSLAFPKPGRAERVDRLFRAEMNTLLVGIAGTPIDVPAPVSRIPLPAPQALLPVALAESARGVVGHVEDEQELVARLTEVAARAQHADESVRLLSRELDRYEQKVRELEDASKDLREKLVDTQLDQLDLTEKLARSGHLVRDLREKLTIAASAAEAWSEPPAELRPQSYPDLLALFPEFEYVVFTGDESVLLDLEKHDQAGIWADRIWQIACALEDYAACIHDGRFDGGVDSYLKAPPGGCRGYPGKHAPDETPAVRNRAKYCRPRTLQVPKEVDASGSVFMGAHFTVAQYGMTSPRVHYHNDVRGDTGRVYIGYAGPHLPSPRTN